ncbi:bis(5'-nucleosyl)-tetraphosphatase (symmetrical) YqeK [Pleurocapsales cyanobacterium LEGE 06147]|nr:bis(5'-nucleosyl)-tetraphosphatase (symmetrical) YqeK [Pleurocapsales cyanobacterium LEGE 06147]
MTLRKRVLSWLTDNVSPSRLEHILGVEQMCIELARYHQVNEQQAAMAGLMHDLAKFFPPSRLLQMARAEGITIDSICATHPHLLHAEVGAIVARDEFGVNDKNVLAAIANHTLGSPGMSRLSCIVFVADALEPNRGNTPELVAMRQVARENLYKSVRQICEYSLRYLINNCKVIHPRTILTRNWALAIANQDKSKVTGHTSPRSEFEGQPLTNRAEQVA